MKKYFSFIGNVHCREIKKISAEVEHIHNVETTRVSIDLFNVRNHPNLVLIVVSAVICGEYGEKQYIALKDSFDLAPAVPVYSFSENLKRSLSY